MVFSDQITLLDSSVKTSGKAISRRASLPTNSPSLCLW